jgi:hypothetical protein
VKRAIIGNERNPRFIKMVTMTMIIAVILRPEDVPLLPMVQRYCFWCIFEEKLKSKKMKSFSVQINSSKKI